MNFSRFLSVFSWVKYGARARGEEPRLTKKNARFFRLYIKSSREKLSKKKLLRKNSRDPYHSLFYLFAQCDIIKSVKIQIETSLQSEQNP